MTAALLAGVAGLALLDALNPATLAGVALLLLAPMARPVLAAAGFVAGAYLTVLALGAWCTSAPMSPPTPLATD
ncbi:hypothetical protein ACFQX7_35850 [Luedemannella flava]